MKTICDRKDLVLYIADQIQLQHRFLSNAVKKKAIGLYAARYMIIKKMLNNIEDHPHMDPVKILYHYAEEYEYSAKCATGNTAIIFEDIAVYLYELANTLDHFVVQDY